MLDLKRRITSLLPTDARAQLQDILTVEWSGHKTVLVELPDAPRNPHSSSSSSSHYDVEMSGFTSPGGRRGGGHSSRINGEYGRLGDDEDDEDETDRIGHGGREAQNPYDSHERARAKDGQQRVATSNNNRSRNNNEDLTYRPSINRCHTSSSSAASYMKSLPSLPCDLSQSEAYDKPPKRQPLPLLRPYHSSSSIASSSSPSTNTGSGGGHGSGRFPLTPDDDPFADTASAIDQAIRTDVSTPPLEHDLLELDHADRYERTHIHGIGKWEKHASTSSFSLPDKSDPDYHPLALPREDKVIALRRQQQQQPIKRIPAPPPIPSRPAASPLLDQGKWTKWDDDGHDDLTAENPFK